MFGRLFKKTKQSRSSKQFLTAKVNARLQPMHRGEFFEEPLEDLLDANENWEVCGGGTMQFPSGEIEYCDIEIQGGDIDDALIQIVVSTLEELGALELTRSRGQFPSGFSGVA